MTKRFALVPALALFLAAPVAFADPPAPEPGTFAAQPDAKAGWKKLGERVVQGKVDTDVIKPSSKAQFTSIAIFVEKEDVALYDIEIEFGNGETFSPATRLLFKEGSRSRVIDLPGKDRVIKKITFKYGNLDAKKHARVEVWAKKA
jgi:hypothetical protein